MGTDKGKARMAAFKNRLKKCVCIKRTLPYRFGYLYEYTLAKRYNRVIVFRPSGFSSAFTESFFDTHFRPFI